MYPIDRALTFWDMRLLVVHSERGWQSLVDECAVYGASPPLPRSIINNNNVEKQGYSKKWATTNVRVVFWHWHKYLHQYFLAGNNLSLLSPYLKRNERGYFRFFSYRLSQPQRGYLKWAYWWTTNLYLNEKLLSMWTEGGVICITEGVIVPSSQYHGKRWLPLLHSIGWDPIGTLHWYTKQEENVWRQSRENRTHATYPYSSTDVGRG